jgi:ribosome-binding protein aMBF1 (putative translation factor)
MEHQDWNTVTWIKKTEKKTILKPAGNLVFKKLDGNDPEPPKNIDHNLKILIQQARVSKKLSQKQLALQLNIHESIVSKYENGNIVPDKKILRKIFTILNIKI